MRNNNFRIGKDLSIVWSLLTNGKPVSLEGRHLSLELTDPMGYEQELAIQVEGCVVKAWFLGDAQKRLGVYKLTLWENKGESGQTVVDNCNAFELVRCSEQENGGYELGESELIIRSCLAVGVAGATPTIDPETGHWVIGGIDTGIKAKGEDGYTPQKDVDYFDGKDGEDGKDGHTPQKGIDYFDGKDGKDGKDGISGGLLMPDMVFEVETGDLHISGTEAELSRIGYDEDESELVLKFSKD